MRDSAENGQPKSAGTIEIAIHQRTGWLTFNNPASHNALTNAM